MSQQKRRFSSRPIIYIFAGAAALLTVISVISVLEVKNIETKLEQEIFTLLAQSGFAAPNIEIDGRNIIFSGTVDAIVDRQKMVAIVQELSGVETVVDQRDVINFTSARHFTLNSYAGITTVEGELPDKMDVRLIEAAIRNHYGVDPLGANLRITPSVKRPEWLDDFPAILSALTGISPLELDYANSILRVSGVAASGKARKKITEQLSSILSSSVILKSEIRVKVSGKASSLKLQYKDGKITIYGTVPDQNFVDTFEQSVKLAFATNSIDNQLKIDTDIDEGSWLDAVLRIVFPLAVAIWIDLDIKEDEIVLRGEVKGDDELEIITEQIQENFGYDTRIINKMKKKTSP